MDAMTAAVPGLDREALLATMPQIMDLCITERSKKNGIGWIEPEIMQKTIDITYAAGRWTAWLKLDEAFTNAYSSKIKPGK